MTDDLALVRRCQQREPDAIRQLIERFQAEIFGLCVRMLCNRHDAEDVCQEIFFRIFRSLHHWDGERPLRPWVMGITVNRCRTWLVRRAKQPESVDYLQDVERAQPEDDSAELQREITAAVACLRPTYRAVFVMFHEHDQSYEAIAEAVNRPVGTVKTWLHRARIEVLERLRERGMVPDEEPELGAPKPISQARA